MERRRLLQLGLGAAAVLAIGGGTLALLQPGLEQGRLAAPGRLVFEHVARGLLDGTLPEPEPQRADALRQLLDRVGTLAHALPTHAQKELSQLLALLATHPGRRLLAGLRMPWPDAGIGDLRQALQQMRVSSLVLRRQAYQALHDITLAAWFSDPAAWAMLGYPGPVDL